MTETRMDRMDRRDGALLRKVGDVIAAEIGLTGREAAEASGASYRQVDNWQTTGFIQPTVQSKGSGRWRRYHPADVEQLRVAVQLLDAEMRLERLREMDPDERARLLKVLAAEGFAP